MQLMKTLSTYETAVDEALAILKRESAQLERCEGLDRTLGEKKALIGRLADLTATLRAAREAGGALGADEKERVQSLQQKMMRLLRLDRENEKKFLASSLRPYAPQMPPAAGVVGRAYGRGRSGAV